MKTIQCNIKNHQYKNKKYLFVTEIEVVYDVKIVLHLYGF